MLYNVFWLYLHLPLSQLLSSVTPPNFVSFFLITHQIQFMLPIYSWVWASPVEHNRPTRSHTLKGNFSVPKVINRQWVLNQRHSPCAGNSCREVISMAVLHVQRTPFLSGPHQTHTFTTFSCFLGDGSWACSEWVIQMPGLWLRRLQTISTLTACESLC